MEKLASGIILGAFLMGFGILMFVPEKKDRTFESPKPIVPELVIKQVGGKSDTTYIYHHPEYYNQ